MSYNSFPGGVSKMQAMQVNDHAWLSVKTKEGDTVQIAMPLPLATAIAEVFTAHQAAPALEAAQ